MIKPIFLSLNDDIDQILWKLQSENINYCVVVDDKQHFIGEISDDILLKIIAHTSINEPLVKILDIWYRRGINFTHSKDYVKRHKNIVEEHTPIFDIMQLIDKKNIQFIPVINWQKQVVWVITPSSILKFVLNR
jgi:predicted transcriptional regulator